MNIKQDNNHIKYKELKKLLEKYLGLYCEKLEIGGEYFAIHSPYGVKIKEIIVLCKKQNIDISDICQQYSEVNIERILNESGMPLIP